MLTLAGLSFPPFTLSGTSYLAQDPAAMSASCNIPARRNDVGGGTGSISSMGVWLPLDGSSSSVLGEDSPGFLRMYIR